MIIAGDVADGEEVNVSVQEEQLSLKCIRHDDT
jgi:hypothetical protein